MSFSIFSFAGLILLSGWVTADRSGFLSGYERLHRGSHLQNYWSSAELTKEAASRIHVVSVEGLITDQPGVTVADACRWLKAAVVSSMRNEPGWSTVDRPEESKSKLVMAITYLTPGSASDRMFASEPGVGHAFAV